MSRYTEGNQVTLLRNGVEYFPALEAAVDGAKHEIHLQTYIYENDEIGQRIGLALKRAAARSVAVCLLVDGFGCKDLPKACVNELQEAGVEVLFFRPKISPWTLKRSRLRRLHRKLAVIDGEIAFIGGINIIDDFDTPGQVAPRIDYAVSVRGPLLAPILASARQLWRRVSWTYLRQVRLSHLHNRLHIAPAGSMRAAFVVRDNLWHRTDIEQAYLTAIARAKSEIVIANAYFLPGIRFRRALREAAQRGVRVVLLLQGKVEFRLLDFASHALYSSLLRHGIEIYEYHKSFMHSKVAVVDQHWATVGSSNIDPFSLLVAREANIVVNDRTFGAELRADIEHTIQDGALQIQPEDWQRGHLIKRSISWLAYGFVRFVLGLIGYPNKH